jgi:hypothetical protein
MVSLCGVLVLVCVILICVLLLPLLVIVSLAGIFRSGIEPWAANVFTEQSAKGTFIRKNPTLVKLLKSTKLIQMKFGIKYLLTEVVFKTCT